MTRTQDQKPKARRFAVIAAALAVATALSGCVIYPAGPGYYHYHRDYYDHDRDWR